jgi:NhaA family Na+:H+ antiporter
MSKANRLFKEFFESERSGGIILILCTAFSLLLANSDISSAYLSFWKTDLGGDSLTHWINEGLMTIFFLMIGLELEREVYKGELSSPKDAMLPIFGALGGMLVPACLYMIWNINGPYSAGAGIPMATDIAFALGILSLLGKKVPVSLKIFLTALAVMDDLGAIIIIALFYNGGIDLMNLFIALGIFVSLLVLNRLRVRNLIPYLIGGAGMWYFMLHSGVHATISGVLLAFAIPFGNGDERSTSYLLQHTLHKPVAWLILPVFALANTAIPIQADITALILNPYSAGIMLGLLVGKPLGIFLFARISVKMRLGKLPADLSWSSIAGAGLLGGIGFTMSIFICLLAFDNEVIINNAKLAILIASTIAGICGYVWLKADLKRKIGYHK